MDYDKGPPPAVSDGCGSTMTTTYQVQLVHSIGGPYRWSTVYRWALFDRRYKASLPTSRPDLFKDAVGELTFREMEPAIALCKVMNDDCGFVEVSRNSGHPTGQEREGGESVVARVVMVVTSTTTVLVHAPEGMQ